MVSTNKGCCKCGGHRDRVDAKENISIRALASLGRPVDVLLTIWGWIVQVQGSNIRHYYAYLIGRAKAYRDTRIDWVREGQGRLKRQTVDKGLLRETETVQSQIAALVKCDVGSNYTKRLLYASHPAAYPAIASQ